MSMKDALVTALHSNDRAKPRSLQTAIGPSQVGDCRRRVWSQLNGEPETNPATLRLAAVMGTAIHTAIEGALRRQDPWEDRYLLEVEVSHDGLTGHVDCYEIAEQAVTDWKTITKKKAPYFPSKQQRWQVHLYGWLMEANGYPVKTVGLVGICRDGSEDDVVEHREPYDPAIAAEALAWLSEVRAMTEAPAPENDAVSFCQHYCEFFGGCPGRGRGAVDPTEPVLAEDEAALVAAFVTARAEVEAAQKRQEAAREALTGVVGRTDDGWAVSWSERAQSTVDRDAVRAVLGDVPMKAGKPSLVLNVKQVAS